MSASASEALSFTTPQPYPYFDFYRHTADTVLPADVAEAVHNASGPVIELGGPTTVGYRQLQDKVLLPGRAYMTNIRDWGDGVETIVDGRDMQFPDNSVGVFLASGLAYTDYFGLAERHPEQSQNEWTEAAVLEYWRLKTESGYAPEYNLRLQILIEMWRTLETGGLAIFESVRSLDVEAAAHLGFAVLHQRPSGPHERDAYDIVLQKPLS